MKPSGIAVDTHCKRISNRIGLSNEKDPSKIEQDLLKQIDEKELGLYMSGSKRGEGYEK